MITRNYSLGQIPDYPFERDYPLDRLAFFDIETTGFAAETSYLYLIGCAYYEASSFYLIQWFSEGIEEEALLLTAFFEFLKNYKILIHYNGFGFDIPYLQKKCRLLNLNYDFTDVTGIDIYRRILPYKKLFGLKSIKLKALEVFFGVNRKDTFSGGELIQVYQSYLGIRHLEALKKYRKPDHVFMTPSQADTILNQLLLHNEDDLRGLLSISPILSYADLFEKPIRILQAGVEHDMLGINFETSSDMPVRIRTGDDMIQLSAYRNSATLSVRIFEGELKYYYDNYRDYYYLPAEDYAVHKSIAGFVDKAYKEKAKPSNCYIKKQGMFAPQYESLITPYFKNNHSDKLSFLEIHTDNLLTEENLILYVTHILKHLIAN